MKVLYVKNGSERDKKFQLQTMIYEENGKKFVKKSILRAEALPYLNKMQDNYAKLSKAIINPKVKLAKIVGQDERSLTFEYIEGVSLAKQFNQIPKTQESVDAFVEAYIDFLKSSFKTTKFDSKSITSEFRELFGSFDYSLLDGEVCFEEISNVDLTFSNIIYRDSDIYIIDYEWAFECEIPIHYIVYRTLYYKSILSSTIASDKIYKSMEHNFIKSCVGEVSFHKYKTNYQKKRSTIEESLHQNVLQHQKLCDYEQQLQEKKEQAKEIKQQLQEKQVQIEAIKQQLQEKQKRLQEADDLCETQRAYIHEMMTSMSWKITHPVRLVSQKLQKARLPKYQNIFIPHTKEYRYSRAIKRRLPQNFSHKIAEVLKKSEKNPFKAMPWDESLTAISADLGKSILIVAELSIPQCKKYRVDQKVEMLEYLGYEVSVVSWNDFFLARNRLQLVAMVIFYRVPAFDIVLDLMREVKRLNIPSFYDVDDLIFDKEELKKNSNNLKLDDKVQKEIYKGADLYQLALSQCDYAIASTAVLGEYMAKYVKGKVFVLPNCLDEELLSFIDVSKKQHVHKKSIQIVYGSGTSTHDSDFLEASGALLRILKRYPQVELVIHGILNLPANFDDFSAQIKKIPVMRASEYYAALNQYDINIAPLEKTVFNDAKSNIKFLEASIFRLPTVASGAYEFSKVIENGQNGFLCDSEDAWFDAIESLVLDEKLRKSIGSKAFDTVMEDYRIQGVAQKLMKPMIEDFVPLVEKKSSTKVLMVNILFQPISFGGATIVVEELSRYINMMPDSEVTLFTGFWNSEKRVMHHHDIVRYEANGLPIIGVKFPAPMTPLLEYKNDDMKHIFIDILKSNQPDIVHFHSIQQLSASLVEACVELDIPYVITLHDMWWLCEKQFMVMDDGKYCAQKEISVDFCTTHCTKDKVFTNLRHDYLLSLLQQASLLLTPSKFQTEMYAIKELDTNNLVVNKNGILLTNNNFVKTKSNNMVRFAYLGGNAVHKGYDWLKEIFESIGEDNYRLTLVDLHKKLGSSSIDEADWNISGELIISDGYMYGQKGLDDFFKDIDVLLFPSQWKESFGLTIREALVRDVWVVSTNAGGVIEDIVDGENGNIIDMNSQESFKSAITKLLHNPEFFKQYENPHKSLIRNFKEQADELSLFYKRVLKNTNA